MQVIFATYFEWRMNVNYCSEKSDCFLSEGQEERRSQSRVLSLQRPMLCQPANQNQEMAKKITFLDMAKYVDILMQPANRNLEDVPT